MEERGQFRELFDHPMYQSELQPFSTAQDQKKPYLHSFRKTMDGRYDVQILQENLIREARKDVQTTMALTARQRSQTYESDCQGVCETRSAHHNRLALEQSRCESNREPLVSSEATHRETPSIKCR